MNIPIHLRAFKTSTLCRISNGQMIIVTTINILLCCQAVRNVVIFNTESKNIEVRRNNLVLIVLHSWLYLRVFAQWKLINHSNQESHVFCQSFTKSASSFTTISKTKHLSAISSLLSLIFRAQFSIGEHSLNRPSRKRRWSGIDRHNYSRIKFDSFLTERLEVAEIVGGSTPDPTPMINWQSR